MPQLKTQVFILQTAEVGLGGQSSAGAEETEAAVTFPGANARESTKEATPAKSPPARMIASHTKPTATVSTGAAPNGATSAAKATSRTQIGRASCRERV